MTVSTTHVKNDFTGDGANTVFNFTFQIQKKDHLTLSLGGVTQATNLYSVVINSDQEAAPGGTVTTNSAPANGVAVSVARATPLTQDVGFNLESLLNTGGLEQVLDKLTMLLQEAKASTQGQTGPQGPQGPQGAAGSMTGPGSSTDGAVALFNGTGGNLLKDGPAPANNGDIMKVVGGAWTAAAAAASIPSGTIVLWDTNMASVPTGWAAMDGQTVTINGVSKVTLDTRGKYVLAAAQADSGSTGYTGSTVRPGTVSGVKNHSHGQGGTVSVNYATSSGTVNISQSGTFNAGFQVAAALPATYSLSMSPHNHAASISGNTQSTADSDRPIECAFLLIIKVDE
ncbi:MAG: hypothetical protein K2X27_13670 [Candidatus Obscuribacterales bacterium]|nr:hypothetical protein [Candidatus Obscuribacterales bacterium]